MSETPYDKLPGVNWSHLKLMRVSPLHYKSYVKRGETAALRLGRCTHTMLLEPHRFNDDYAIYSGHRRGNAWAEFKTENATKTILTQEELDKCTAMMRALRGHPGVTELISKGVTEQPLVWTDEETGVECKGRLDYAGFAGRLMDLKTTEVIEPRRFAGVAARLGYHCQTAFYLDGGLANGFDFRGAPVILCVQQSPPNDVVYYEVPEHVVAAGRAEYRRLLRRLVKCRETGVWPGVADGERMELILPEWIYKDDDEPLTLTVGGVEMEF